MECWEGDCQVPRGEVDYVDRADTWMQFRRHEMKTIIILQANEKESKQKLQAFSFLWGSPSLRMSSQVSDALSQEKFCGRAGVRVIGWLSGGGLFKGVWYIDVLGKQCCEVCKVSFCASGTDKLTSIIFKNFLQNFFWWMYSWCKSMIKCCCFYCLEASVWRQGKHMHSDCFLSVTTRVRIQCWFKCKIQMLI